MKYKKSLTTRKILKLKRKLEALYPPDQANLLYLAQIVEKISHYANCLNWKVDMIRIEGIFRGLVIGTDNYLHIVCDHNPSDWIEPLDPDVSIKVKKIRSQKYYLRQILKIVSLTLWTLKIPKTPENLNIIFPGMILVDEEFSEKIVEQIPDDYFCRPGVLDQFLKK